MDDTNSDYPEPYISHDGPLPKTLYRYRSVTPKTLNRLIDFEIRETGIFLAQLKDLNDPDEFRYLFTFDGTYDEIHEFWMSKLAGHTTGLPRSQITHEATARTQQIVADRSRANADTTFLLRHTMSHVMGVACFTCDPINYSMWANYAKYVGKDKDGGYVSEDHGGVCLEYECDENWRSLALCPVKYSNEIPTINALRVDEKEWVSALYCKGREWRAEEEWRISFRMGDLTTLPASGTPIKLKTCVKSVIFGMRTPEIVQAEVVARVKPTNPAIKFKKVATDPMTLQRKLIDL